MLFYLYTNMGKGGRQPVKAYLNKLKNTVNEVGFSEFYKDVNYFSNHDKEESDVMYSGKMKSSEYERNLEILKTPNQVIININADENMPGMGTTLTLCELLEHPNKYLIFYPQFCFADDPLLVFSADIGKRRNFYVPLNSNYRVQQKDLFTVNEKFMIEAMGILSENEDVTVESDFGISLEPEDFDYNFKRFVKVTTMCANACQGHTPVKRNIFTKELYDSLADTL